MAMRHAEQLLKLAEEWLQLAKMAGTEEQRQGNLAMAEKYASLATEAGILEAEVCNLNGMSDAEVEALAERMVNNTKSTL